MQRRLNTVSVCASSSPNGLPSIPWWREKLLGLHREIYAPETTSVLLGDPSVLTDRTPAPQSQGALTADHRGPTMMIQTAQGPQWPGPPTRMPHYRG